MAPDLIRDRRTATNQRITELREALDALDVTSDRLRRTCVYATGSIGRGEASRFSDLDIFLLDLGHPGAQAGSPDTTLGQMEQILVKADIIRAAAQAEFEPFSGDGEYLVVHTVEEMLALLGGREDDARNLFSARLLMLLEGIPLLNDAVYTEALRRIVDRYWADYPAHPHDFMPVMLANDIMRFWKTLTLNYEKKRNVRPPRDTDAAALWRAKRWLDAFKLGFSRLWICHSATAYLVWLSARGPVTAADAVEMFEMSPSERLERLAAESPDDAPLVREILDRYAWFLDKTDHPKDDLLRWISDADERHAARQEERLFGDAMYQLLQRLNGEGPLLRYLVV